MAYTKSKSKTETAQAPNKKKWVILGAAVVALLIGIGIGLFMYLNEHTDSENKGGSNADTLSAELAKNGAFYIPMPRPFVFNLLGVNRSYLVQIKVQIQVRGIESQTLALKHIPLMEDTLLKTFSSAQSSELRTKEGKDQLRQQALDNIKTTLNNVIGHTLIERVLFTDFVMQ